MFRHQGLPRKVFPLCPSSAAQLSRSRSFHSTRLEHKGDWPCSLALPYRGEAPRKCQLCPAGGHLTVCNNPLSPQSRAFVTRFCDLPEDLFSPWLLPSASSPEWLVLWEGRGLQPVLHLPEPRACSASPLTPSQAVLGAALGHSSPFPPGVLLSL